MAKGSCLPTDFTVFFLSVHVKDYFFDATGHIYFFPDITGHASSSCHIACPLLICVRDMFFFVCGFRVTSDLLSRFITFLELTLLDFVFDIPSICACVVCYLNCIVSNQ